jgi:hypothetical protein
MIFIMAKNIHLFSHEISYYCVKVWIIIVPDIVILKVFQVFLNKKIVKA